MNIKGRDGGVARSFQKAELIVCKDELILEISVSKVTTDKITHRNC